MLCTLVRHKVRKLVNVPRESCDTFGGGRKSCAKSVGQIMSPFALPKDKGGNGTYTFPELSTLVRPVVNEMCTFFNATASWALSWVSVGIE